MVKKAVFKDTVDKELEERVQSIVNKKITEREEQEKKKSVQEKLDAIKKTLVPQALSKASGVAGVEKEATGAGVSENGHIHSHNDDTNCPTCAAKGHKHTIKIIGRVAKCTGPDCGTEYLLEQKPKVLDKNKRKDLLCTTCGHSMTEDEIKGKDSCPLCGIGKGVMKVNWADYDLGRLEKTKTI